MTAWIAWAFGLPGFAALSLAMERHQLQVFDRPLGRGAAWAARLAGIALLLVALAWCATAWHGAVAAVAWLGVLSFAALPVGLLLTYRPRRLPLLAAVVLAAGVLAALFLTP
ncbi:DUF3325 domain-containing protein [Pseudorhodoferax sp.]|uniref:DUF3325 domain-containing protein n=1 Tax=Pseudorhodoferax sp. TaxID=1993553 RepID=UPI0039E2F7BE